MKVTFKRRVFYIPDDVYRRLRVLLLTKGYKTVSEWIREQAEKYIEKNS